MRKQELSKMTVADLKAMAKKRKTILPAGARKDDIIRILAKSGTKAKTIAKGKTKAKTGARATAPAKAKGKAKTAAKTGARTIAKTRAAGKKPVLKKAAAKRALPPSPAEPLMAQEQVTVAKFYTGAPEHAPGKVPQSLPHEYGEERIAILARDPDVAYVYWEVPEERMERERGRHGRDSRLCIRVYDVTGVTFDGTNATAYYDQDVYERIGSWYFSLRRPGRTVCADIGLRSADGRFVTIARSNLMNMPKGEVSDVLDEEWMIVEQDFLKLYGVPGWITGGLSSPEVQELLRYRRLMDISSPGAFSRPKAGRK